MKRYKNQARDKMLHDNKILVIGRFDTPTFHLIEFLKKNTHVFTALRTSLQIHKLLPPLQLIHFRTLRQISAKNIRHFFIAYSENKTLRTMQFLIMYLYILIHIFFFFLRNKNYEIVIGIGPFNAMLAVFYKHFNKKAKIVYYEEDKIISDIKRDILGKLTSICDLIASARSTMVWVMSKDFLAEIPKNKRYKFCFVPIPIVRRVAVHTKSNIHKLVFVGSISLEHGFDLLYRVFKRISKDYSDLKLIVIGSGSLIREFKEKSKQDGLNQLIEYKGFIEDQNKILKVISDCDIGIAPYNPFIYKNLAYGQSSKITNYLACGLPVIVTGNRLNIPSLAKYIKKYHAGFVIDFDEEQMLKYIRLLINNSELYKKIKQNVYSLVELFEDREIYNNAFKKLLSI